MEKYVHIRIPELLKEKEISKNQLCKDLNMQRSNLNKYCNDKFLRIDAALIIKLCDYFQCKISDLLEIRELDNSQPSTKLLTPVRRKSKKQEEINFSQ